MSAKATLANHAKELGALAKRMDPGPAKDRVEARLEEAKKALADLERN